MNEIILNYLAQAILGGASGYITNDYAINMLFKEYTPLKIGGVIKKTRTEFIENISSMVENDIISKSKLQEILSDESFKKEFEALTADFYENSLYEAAGSAVFANIDGFDSTVKTTDEFVAGIINEHVPELCSMMIENLNLNDFLNTEQLDTISGEIYAGLIRIFGSSHIIENIILSLYKNNEKLVLNDILDKSIYQTIISNAAGILTKTASDCGGTDIEELLNSVGISSALDALKESLYKRKVKEIINLDGNILAGINNSLLSYVNSERGTENLNRLLCSLFSYGKECDKSVFSLLDSSFEKNLKQYLTESIPSLTEKIVTWLNANSQLIDRMIEDSIDEVIKESDGLKAKLLSTIKNTYFSSLSKKYSIVDKIISYVKNFREPEKLSKPLSDKIIDILNNLTVGEIIAEAENNNITPENAAKLIINYVNKNSGSIINKTAAYISESEVQQILPEFSLKDIAARNLKALASSDIAKNYLAAKATDYADKMFEKELGQLIDEEKVGMVAVKINEFVGKKLDSNSDSVKKWIACRIKSWADGYSINELNSDTIKRLNEKIYEGYGKAVSELKDVPLSAALDKLNSVDNLAKNSSESLRSYAVKNTDVILSGSIKAIVTDNLNKLDDDELVDLANEFIGKELKPIMYFGGVLGAAAGIILAAFQSSPVAPAQISPANMVVYAFVGFITNVIAINMIFRPYKEKKLLSRIPFLHNFSLGYIVRNQKIFAESTAHFIDNSLLDKKSIGGLFDKYKDNIKQSFTNTIAHNDYETISCLLADNRRSVVKKMYLYLKSKISDNFRNISGYLYGRLKSIRISSLINERTADKMSSMLISKLKSPETGKRIHLLTVSDKKIGNIVLEDAVKNYLCKAGYSGCNKLNSMLSGENEFKNLILRYEDSYRNIVKRQINEIIAQETGKKLAQSAADKISSIILSQDSRDEIINKGINLINSSIDRNKSFEEIFDGKFRAYVDSKMPKIFENMYAAAVKSIKENKSRIAATVQAEIKAHLGLLERGMYSLMGGDEIVDELLTRIINNKIPKFMEAKKQELYNIASGLMEEKFYKTKVDVLYTGLNKFQLNNIVSSYLNQENSAKIEKKINVLTVELFSKAGNTKLSSILRSVNMNKLNTMLNVYGNEIDAFTGELSACLRNNKNQIAENMSAAAEILTGKLINTQIKELFSGMSEEDAVNAVNMAADRLNDNGLQEIIRSSLKDCGEYLNVNAGELISEDEFMKSAEQYFISLLGSAKFEVSVKEHLKSVIDKAVSVNFGFLSDETKIYVLNIFVDSCISSLKRNLDEVLKAVEFDKIAKEEIEKMEPKKIHEMFNSFGEKYFRRLMLYGFGGFVFGINMYTGMTLAALKVISEVKNKIETKNETK